MSYHIIDISTNNVSLSVKDGQLVCRSHDGSAKQLPMEDVGAILVNCFSATFHSSFLIEVAKCKIAVVVCECFKPVSLVLPVQRSSDTILTRAQIQASMKLLRTMWLETINAKCANQYELIARLCPDCEKELVDFRISMKNNSAAKEGNCARTYWKLFSRAMGIKKFRRITRDGGLNSLLNYGYAVLMLRIEQKLLACGLDPLYGMGHYPRERSLPLAYDMMEPFRPAVDEMIYEWVMAHESEEDVFQVGKPFKTYIQGIMNRKYNFRKVDSTPLDMIAELVIKSYRVALMENKAKEYHPWIRRNSRWDG